MKVNSIVPLVVDAMVLLLVVKPQHMYY